MTEPTSRRPVFRATYQLFLLGMILLCGPSLADDDSGWPVGRWQLVHDPEGREQDSLEFLPNGEAHSIWPDGTRVSGIYIVTSEGIKAVFSLAGRDIITTFHVDADRQRLRIVTSQTGRESVYRKLP